MLNVVVGGANGGMVVGCRCNNGGSVGGGDCGCGGSGSGADCGYGGGGNGGNEDGDNSGDVVVAVVVVAVILSLNKVYFILFLLKHDDILDFNFCPLLNIIHVNKYIVVAFLRYIIVSGR